ncbi:hypothetical protein LRS13_23145 [Svornostia abyssi]|uniref:Uncharacterized protein n=1 Tax=Svornostia abyssi TaxID=2898438 RepID=A0ABY5PGC8_9ACTN|nr:hypothetical protein LRS13_23145 [Parviterribacteraceae bacterium J379]
MRGALAAALLAAGLLAGCGASDDEPQPAPRPERPALQTGVLEGNPHLLNPGAVPAEFAPWRDRLAELRPRFVRVLVDWEKLQPVRDVPPRFDVPSDGCMRGAPPCAPHSGIRDVLRALAARRAAGEDGWEPVVVIYGTPAWAARTPRTATPRGGECGLSSRAREPDPAAYAALVRALREEARADGVPLRWWAPWNEPNHPAFLAPQRARCDEDSTSTSAARYARIVDAFRAKQQPGERMLLGETAGYDAPRPSASSVTEFIDDLPRDTVCATPYWAQHVYVAQPGGTGSRKRARRWPATPMRPAARSSCARCRRHSTGTAARPHTACGSPRPARAARDPAATGPRTLRRSRGRARRWRQRSMPGGMTRASTWRCSTRSGRTRRSPSGSPTAG